MSVRLLWPSLPTLIVCGRINNTRWFYTFSGARSQDLHTAVQGSRNGAWYQQLLQQEQADQRKY